MNQIDTLVAGQGLAGSLLAMMLADRGVDVRVVAPGPEGSATAAAAGILSPFTGPRYQAPARLAELLTTARSTYQSLEDILGCSLFTPQPIWRVLQAPEEIGQIKRRQEQHPAGDYLPFPTRDGLPEGVMAPYGATCMRGGGHVALGQLQEHVRHHLHAAGRLIEDTLAPEAVLFEAEGTVRWQQWRARRIIFCDGAGAFTNPWWRHLPWRRSRGESLTIASEAPQGRPGLPGAIITGGKSLVPLDNGTHRLGATYDRDHAACHPTEAAREELLAALPRLLLDPPPVRVVRGHAGVRPGSHPGPPFIGMHPQDDRIGILNGLGSRGTLLGPWHAIRLADHIALGRPLPADADVRQRRDLPCRVDR